MARTKDTSVWWIAHDLRSLWGFLAATLPNREADLPTCFGGGPGLPHALWRVVQLRWC